MTSVPIADRIVIDTASHSLTTYSHGVRLRTYSVSLGRSKGAKEFAGDHKTPVGTYRVDSKNPQSRFHLALHLSYPNDLDRANAAVFHRPPGGDVEIHGLPAAFAFLGSVQRLADWTDGCIAVANSEMDELYAAVPVGTPVEIKP